ncbi:zf-3CxxC domain-containing protein [Caerostris extrusa]|uniref:Zf-3CxxC domain-containing protein n=1 Tax=Caerostris extrusa TaxID=172846 RepID=A0AAV4WIV3_CAEEX|nr:zf-3CxxC domain-containing protein [Caerostris extrusa]
MPQSYELRVLSGHVQWNVSRPSVHSKPPDHGRSVVVRKHSSDTHCKIQDGVPTTSNCRFRERFWLDQHHDVTVPAEDQGHSQGGQDGGGARQGAVPVQLLHQLLEFVLSWIQIDLMEQRIVYRWKMKCKVCCINPRHIGVEPTFELAETEKLIEKAIYKYKGERYSRGAAYRGSRIPHPNVLCEKCLWGQTQCWLTMHR